jgi:hypothetical protein
MNPITWFIRKYFLIKEIFSQEGELHFQRYRILSTSRFNIYLHRISKSDEDRHFHDHPFSFYSFLIKGSYIDRFTYTPYHYVLHTRTYKAGDIVEHDAEDAHSITLLTPVVWTLVLTGKRKRMWGYRISPEQWIDFKTYRQLKRAGKLPT